MIILGINAYHGDAASAIIRDGELITTGKSGTGNLHGLGNGKDATIQMQDFQLSQLLV